MSIVWSQSAAHMPRSIGAAPVPDIDGLRRAALQASWRRDRRVARRRMAVRWAVWYAVRGLPLVLIAAVVWFLVLPRLTQRALTPASKPAAQQAASSASVTVVPPMPAEAAPQSTPATPDPLPREAGLQLRLDGPFASPSSPSSSLPTSPTSQIPLAPGKQITRAPATDSPSPQLKPDNWLHSQEP